MVLDDFIYMSGTRGLIGPGRPHLMSSSAWVDIFCQMGNTSLTIQQASPASSRGALRAAKEGKSIFKPLFASCLLMLLNYSKSHELRGGERLLDRRSGNAHCEGAYIHTYIQGWMELVAFLKFDT